MKKLISLFVALSLLLSLPLVASAEGTTGNTPGPSDIGVNGTFATQTPDTVYRVDVQWSAAKLTYTAPERVWNPETLKYEEVLEDGDGNSIDPWGGSAITVTVTNHSNAPISATPGWSPSADYSGVGMTFDAASLSLNSALYGAQEGTIVATPGGTLANSSYDKAGATTEHKKVGTLTVTIAAGQETGVTTVTTLEDLQTALRSGGLIRLGADISGLSETLAVISTAAIDLNGHTLDLGDCMLRVNAGTNLTVADGVGSGVITSSDYSLLVQTDSTLTVYGGSITGGTYGISNSSTLTVYGGNIEGDVSGIYNSIDSVATVSGGSVKGKVHGIMNEGTLTVNGGTIEGSEYSIHNLVALNIAGGTVSGDIENTDGTVTITGGYFNSPLNESWHPGYVTSTPDADGYYTVIKIN